MRLVGLSLLALLSVSTATELHVLGFGEGVFNKRQDTTAVSSNDDQPAPSTGGSTPAPSSSNNDDEPSSAAPSSNPPTPTPTPTSSANPTSNGNGGSSSAPPPSSSQSSEAPSSSSVDDSTTVTEEQSTVVTPFTSEVTIQVTRTIRTTASNGQETDLVTTENSVSTFTGEATSLGTVGNDQNNSGGGGLTDTNKKVIAGVVGGVGGALLLGGLALVYFRLRKKNHRQSPIEDEYAGMDHKAGPNNHGAQPLNNQFQTTLDQYHNPPPRPNAAANF